MIEGIAGDQFTDTAPVPINSGALGLNNSETIDALL